jgi:predicted nucleic acid-binding protein
MDRSGKYLIDSMIVIWGIKREEDSDKVTEARQFIERIDKINGVELLIPAPVVTEILCPYDGGHPKFSSVQYNISSDFRILPFDFKSAVKAAELLNAYKDDGELKEMLKNEGYNEDLSTKIKYDIQIVAIALAYNLQGIISEERNAIKRYAEGKMDVLSMKSFFDEGTLFDGRNERK